MRHGATPQEAAEAIGVTFLMNGGPATVYGARAFAAFREFYDQRSATNSVAAQVQQPGTSTASPTGTSTPTEQLHGRARQVTVDGQAGGGGVVVVVVDRDHRAAGASRKRGGDRGAVPGPQYTHTSPGGHLVEAVGQLVQRDVLGAGDVRRGAIRRRGGRRGSRRAGGAATAARSAKSVTG